MLSTVRSGFRHLSLLSDPGSNLTIITHDAARKLCLRGKDMYVLNKGRKSS